MMRDLCVHAQWIGGRGLVGVKAVSGSNRGFCVFVGKGQEGRQGCQNSLLDKNIPQVCCASTQTALL